MKVPHCLWFGFVLILILGGMGIILADTYRIQVNDVLEVTVWNHPELSKIVVVPTDGYVSYPLVGRIFTRELTVVELEEMIRERLTPHIVDPQVSVMLKKYQKDVVHVLGAVKNSGTFDYQRGKTLVDYLGLAGGPTSRANLKKLTVNRRDSTNVYSIVIDTRKVLREGNRELNIQLYPNDTVFVPESFLSGWRDWATLGSLFIGAITVYVVAKRWSD